MESIFFTIVAAAAILFSLLVITCKNPINSALSLVMTFFCLATFYVMLDAPFMAAIQVIVYAGAIMVLIIFVIMLLNLGHDFQPDVSAELMDSHRSADGSSPPTTWVIVASGSSGANHRATLSVRP